MLMIIAVVVVAAVAVFMAKSLYESHTVRFRMIYVEFIELRMQFDERSAVGVSVHLDQDSDGIPKGFDCSEKVVNETP